MLAEEKKMMNIPALLQKAHIHEGMHVADFGCGKTGFITLELARVLGESGIVYAVDILKNVVENVKRLSDSEGFTNVQVVWSDLELPGKTAIPAMSLDAVFMVNILSQSKNKQGILNEAKRLLKDKARIIVVDWAGKAAGFGPTQDRLVNFQQIKEWGRENGFAVQEEFDAGAYHKGLVLFKHD